MENSIWEFSVWDGRVLRGGERGWEMREVRPWFGCCVSFKEKSGKTGVRCSLLSCQVLDDIYGS